MLFPMIRISILLALVWLSGGAAASDDLARAIVSAHWDAAHRAYARMAPSQSIKALRPLATDNVVMSQWFLADALAQQGAKEEAARWLYTASLGTRLDASICVMRAADLVESRFAHAYDVRFRTLRRDEPRRREALKQAVVFHDQRRQRSKQPDWVCQLVNQEAGKPRGRITVPEQRWPAQRERALQEYRRQTGLDFSRSPDLIPIRSAIP